MTTNSAPLTAEQILQAMLAAFPTITQWDQLVSLYLEVNRADITLGENLVAVGLAVLRWAEAQGRLDILLQAASRTNPGNPELQRVWAAWVGQRQDVRYFTNVGTNPALLAKIATEPRQIALKGESRKQFLWLVLMSLVVLALIGLLLSSIMGKSLQVVANQKMGISASLPRRASCRIYLNISNIGQNGTAIDSIAPLVYVGDNLLPFNEQLLQGSDGSVTYKVLYWDSEPFVEPASLVTSDWSYQPSGAFPKALTPGPPLQLIADVIIDAPKTPWLFRGRGYPYGLTYEPELPNKNHLSIGFKIHELNGNSTNTRLRSCSTIEVPTNPDDFKQNDVRIATGDS